MGKEIQTRIEIPSIALYRNSRGSREIEFWKTGFNAQIPYSTPVFVYTIV